jgi:hypothetical protein
MTAGITTAKKFFEENMHLFANAQTEPEKFNLYNGLWNLADSLQQIETEMHRLQQQVINLHTMLSLLKR